MTADLHPAWPGAASPAPAGASGIERAVQGSRTELLTALCAAVAAVTDEFVLLDHDPPVWRIVARGRAVPAREADRILALVGERDTPIPGRWVPVDVDDTLTLVVPADRAPALIHPVGTARMALRAQRAEHAAAAAEADVRALQSVATRILGAKELDEALLAVTNETLGLLQADIAGVMLRDGDEIVMRACAGNQLADTGKLRMRRGQGLAGHVFATGRAAKVDDYLRNDIISNDFNYLARAERTRSALGAPLVVGGRVIGVLEVWRRRESTFTAGEIRRLVALADLAAIALDNARQHEISRASQRAVGIAHRALQAQLGRVEQALAGQQALIEALVDGEQLAGIARIVADRAGCAVVLLDNDLDVLGEYGTGVDLPAVRAAVAAERPAAGHEAVGTGWAGLGDRSVAIRAVRSGAEQVGWVCLVTDAAAGDEEIELAATQAALTVALHHLEQQAAAKARASLREELLLNLIKGSPDERRAAVARARYLQIDLRGDLRICVCTFAGLEAVARSSGWSTPNLDQMRRKLFHLGEESLARAGVLRLAAGNGNGLVALIHPGETADVHPVVAAVTAALVAQVPQCRPSWGISAPHSNPYELDRAHTEAMTAAQALGPESGRQVALYEELGVLALLIAGPDGTPLGRFAQDTIGPILAHDARHGTCLVDTLRAYLDLDCHQRDTATRLFVHQKTVKYRLETIEKLTGLDLHRHADRMRADIAVRANDLR